MEHPSIPDILHISSDETPTAFLLHMAGELDLLSAPSLKEHLLRLIADGGGRPIIVDCSALRYLDMRGIRVLEDCHRRAEHEGVRLVLVGSQPLVHKTLTIVSLDQRIPIVETVADALRTLGQDEGTSV